MSHFPTGTGQVPSAREWEQRLEDEAAEREMQEMLKEAPDLVLAMDYASGALSPEQVADFEQRMLHDEALQDITLPLLQLRQELREGRDRAIEQGADAARLAWERLQLEARAHWANEPPDFDADAEEQAPRHSAAAGRTRTVRNQRLLRVMVRILGLAAVCYVGAYALSLVGFAPLLPSWNVVREETAPRTWLELRNGVSLSAISPMYVAERWPGLLGGGDRLAPLAEVYIDAPDFTITGYANPKRTLRIVTPQLDIRVQRGGVHVWRENGCEIVVSSLVHPVTVTTRLVSPAISAEVSMQKNVRMSCDGTLGKPTTYLPPAAPPPEVSPIPTTTGAGAPS
jgi:hypothetical protein